MSSLEPGSRSTVELVDREHRERERERLAQLDREAKLERRQLRSIARARRSAERQDARRFTAERRRRRRAWLIGIGTAVVALAVLIGLVTSPAMSVREIRVAGSDRVSADEIRAALDDQLGKPLALVREDEVGQRLQGFAALESFSVDLAPPSTIVIRVIEREPVALTESGELMDAAGVTLGEPREGEGELPTVVGVTPGGETFAAVARVLQNLPPELLTRIETVTAETPESIQLTVDSGETVIWGGAEQSTLKADTVRVLLDGHVTDGGTIDVSAPEHPVVR